MGKVHVTIITNGVAGATNSCDCTLVTAYKPSATHPAILLDFRIIGQNNHVRLEFDSRDDLSEFVRKLMLF